LDTGNLSMLGTLMAELDLNNNGLPAADLLDVMGTVSLANATLDLPTLNAPALYSGGLFLLVANDAADPVSGTFASITGLPAGYSAMISYAFSGTDSLGRVGDGNDIAVQVVPEPGTLVCLLVPALVLATRRRKH
jgi:hypothetical protein